MVGKTGSLSGISGENVNGEIITFEVEVVILLGIGVILKSIVLSSVVDVFLSFAGSRDADEADSGINVYSSWFF